MANRKAEDKIKELAKEVSQKAEPIIDHARKQSRKATDAAANVAARFTRKEEIFVQYGNYEVRTRDIMDRAKADYISKGHSQKDIKEIQIYIKPADNAAYYVVNNTDTGKLEV